MKSYFNVPHHINTNNRHLGIEKNVRKNKYEPRAKKKHRVARLRFLNDKRNYEIFQMSLDAMRQYIDVVNQHYYNLKILEEERIQNMEIEKLKIKQEAEIQKQRDIENFEKTISMMQEQLSLIPKYQQYIKNIIIENKIIEEEEKRINEIIKQERNDDIVKSFRNYFDEIKTKKEDNIKLLDNLRRQRNRETLYKSYIASKNKQFKRYDNIYCKAVDINNRIINDKLKMQNLLDKWGNNINEYNDYIHNQSNIISNFQKEQEFLDHEKKINHFKNEFSTLNNEVIEIIKNIDKNNIFIDEINDESIEDIPEIEDIQINETYINHFNSALKQMELLQKTRIDKINQLKLIEEEQRAMIAREEQEKKYKFEKNINDYRNFIKESRKHRKKLIEQEQNYIKKQEEISKQKEQNRLENKAIKLKNDINKFNQSIQLYNQKRDDFIKMKAQEKLRKQKENEKLLLERDIKNKRDQQLTRQLEHLQVIDDTVQNIYIKQIEEIEENYKNYQEEILRLEEEKEREQLIEQEKLQILINKHNLQKENFITLEKEYNDILIKNQLKLEEEEFIKQKEKEREETIINSFNDEIIKIKTINLIKAKQELEKREEEIKQQELLEYENKLILDNNIKYYSNLIVENKKSHELFEKHMKEYKEKELAKLEEIKALEKYEYNREVVLHSIDYILDNVDIEIETIEYNKTISRFDSEINQFHNNVELCKEELERLKQKQQEEIEYEKLQIELYEEEMLRYKENQEKLLISQMNDMILQFKINTKEHIEYIEKQKRDAELAEIKKKEEEEENIRIIKQEQQSQLNKSISYYKIKLNEYDKNISDYKNTILEIEKKIEMEKRKYEAEKKLEEERIIKLQEDEEKQVLDNFKKSVKKYRDNINILEKQKLKDEEAAIKEKKRIEEESILKQRKIHNDYINHYTQSIKNTREAYNNFIKNKELARIQYDKEQKIILENIENKKKTKFNKLTNEYKSNLLAMKDKKEYFEKLRLDKENAIREKEHEKQIFIDNLKEEKRVKMIKLIDDYKSKLDDIQLRKDSIKEQKIEKERLLKEYEKQQNELLLQQEKIQLDIFNNLLASFNDEIIKIEEQHQQNIAEQQLAKEEYEKQQKELILQQEKDRAYAFNNLVISFNKDIVDMENLYKDIKTQEEIKQKNFELEKERDTQKKVKEQQQLLNNLEDKYRKSLNNISVTMKEYKTQLNKYNDEQANILKEEEFKKEEERLIKQKLYHDSIEEYENTIAEYNEMIRIKKDNIAQDKLKQEIEHQKIIEDTEKEKVRLQKIVVENYEKQINKFYDNQNKLMNELYEKLKKEKEYEHKKRMLKLEERLDDKINSMENEDNIIQKIDNTINYIKDLNDNKENVDFINKLKHQYDNSYINPDNEKFIDNKDILSVGENTLTFDNFSLYNRFTFNVVPKIIYQTWPTKNLTNNMAWVVNRLRSTHSDFKYHLFDDNDCRDFIKEHFGMETLWAFDRLIPGAFKADLWRYCAMYITGGIYLDIKMCPVNGFRFDYLLKNDWYCADIARGNGFAGIWQGILVSRPRNPIFKYLIDEVIKNVKAEYYGDDPLDITGPKMMKRILNIMRIKVNDSLQIKKYLNKKASTLTKREYKVGICIDNIECLLEYDEYRKECLRTGIHYNEAWKNNQVYNKSILLENYVSETV